MKRAKKIIVILAVVAVIALICVFAFCNRTKNYSDALKECSRVLSKNKEEMTSISLTTLKGDLTSSNYSSGEYKDYSYTMTDKREFVQFDIGAQGMLGGQYWSLVYCKDGTYMGQSETYYYEENGGGNNICKAERIDGNWWFLWLDYDGTELSNG